MKDRRRGIEERDTGDDSLDDQVASIVQSAHGVGASARVEVARANVIIRPRKRIRRDGERKARGDGERERERERGEGEEVPVFNVHVVVVTEEPHVHGCWPGFAASKPVTSRVISNLLSLPHLYPYPSTSAFLSSPSLSFYLFSL